MSGYASLQRANRRDYDSGDESTLSEGVPLGSWPVAMDGLHELQAEADLESDGRRPLPFLRILLLAALQIGVSFNSFLCLIVVVPSQIALIAGGERKGKAVGVVLGMAGVLSLVGAPLLGTLSDLLPWSPRIGRRMPLLLVGAVVTSLATWAMLYARTVAWYALLYSAVTAGSLIQTVPFQGLIADTVPLASRGVASGVIGAAGHLGSLMGALVSVRVSIRDRFELALLMGGVLALTTLVTAVAVREPPPLKTAALRPTRSVGALAWSCSMSYVEPLVLHHDFRWVFVTRLLMQQGVYTVQEFLLFYMKDMVHRPEGTRPSSVTMRRRGGSRRPSHPPSSPRDQWRVSACRSASKAVGIAMLTLLCGATPAALLGGGAADRLGRKLLVYSAGVVMSGCAVFSAFNTSYERELGNCFVFGIGYGAFLAVDYAMVLDVLPSATNAAKDMAVWHAALVLPQMLATPIAGGLLDHFQKVGRAAEPGSYLGYQVVFLLAAAYFAVGTALVSRLRKVS